MQIHYYNAMKLVNVPLNKDAQIVIFLYAFVLLAFLGVQCIFIKWFCNQG